MKLLIDNIALRPDEDPERIAAILKERYSLDDTCPFVIARKSLDARHRERIRFRYRVIVEVPDDLVPSLLDYKDVSLFRPIALPPARKIVGNSTVFITGSGPAGLFCALRLIEAGVHVEIFERGKPVEERMKDILVLEDRGTLDEASNVLFGEGGAGTYSDGKLTARTRGPESEWLFGRLVEFGAPSSILYEAKPHLGTDRLREIVTQMRRAIQEAGSRIHFSEAVTDIIVRAGVVAGVMTSRKRKFECAALVLATGHSARDTYEMLARNGIALEQKGFAAGVRIEHPAEVINAIQYGDSLYRPYLPAADYNMAWTNRATGRAVYTFCMCPGGRVINSSSEREKLCINGMSFSGRDLPFSNAALVVSVRPGDFGDGVLDGIEFQRRIEDAAYRAGGGSYRAPAQRVTGFMAGRRDADLPPVSYRPGVSGAEVRSYLPGWMVDELKEGLRQFEKRMKGFMNGEAVLMGAETRTSSPVRILRGDDFQSRSLRGLFPAGEGAGYAGGIVSSAVDGIRCADRITAFLS